MASTPAFQIQGHHSKNTSSGRSPRGTVEDGEGEEERAGPPAQIWEEFGTIGGTEVQTRLHDRWPTKDSAQHEKQVRSRVRKVTPKHTHAP